MQKYRFPKRLQNGFMRHVVNKKRIIDKSPLLTTQICQNLTKTMILKPVLSFSDNFSLFFRVELRKNDKKTFNETSEEANVVNELIDE